MRTRRCSPTGSSTSSSPTYRPIPVPIRWSSANELVDLLDRSPGRRPSRRPGHRRSPVDRSAVLSGAAVRTPPAAGRHRADRRRHPCGGTQRSRLGPVRGRRLASHPDPAGGTRPPTISSRWPVRSSSVFSRSRGAARLLAHTGGNPLYCSSPAPGDRRCRPQCHRGGGLPAPRDLSAVILTRVAALSDEAQTLPGRRIGPGPARAHRDHRCRGRSGRCQVGPTRRLLPGCWSRVPRRSSPLPIPLYRAAIYADLSPTNRRRLHTRRQRSSKAVRAWPIGWPPRWAPTTSWPTSSSRRRRSATLKATRCRGMGAGTSGRSVVGG